jgi:pilus assembly protein Flp/PilA
MRGSLVFKGLLRDNRGATAIEYGLVLALVCLAILAMIQATAGEVLETWTNVESSSSNAVGTIVPMD